MQAVIFDFIVNPGKLSNYCKLVPQKSLLNKLYTTFKIYLYCTAFMLFGVLMRFIVDNYLIKYWGVSIQDDFKHNHKAIWHDYSKIHITILSVLIAPVWEEFVFRLPLIVNRLNFSIWIFISLIYFSGTIGDFNFSSAEENTRAGMALIISILFWRFTPDAYLRRIKNQYYNILIYFSIISFSLIHISNYAPIRWNVLLFYPVYVLPQLFYAIGLSYLRVKYSSMLWPILLHMIINGVPAILRSL
ncbi:CPBP family glutamic-type intramembrane protease [Runella sp.]|uniref:CPBP family glutamic-type intramembrane protease n=1 Tax=Runella sp. TaxID=1960881 RepID=UPI003D12CBAE